MYACAEGNCQRHGRDDCSVRRQDPADESGRQANRQAGGTGVEVVHPLERGLVMDGGAGMPDSLQEIESNSLSAKVAETND